MRGKRLTVAGSVGLVALVALGLGALRTSDEWSAGTMYLLAILATLTAAMGAAFAAGGTRAFCAGFATFCGAYLVLVFSPWSTAMVAPAAPQNGMQAFGVAPLPTLPLLLRLHAMANRRGGMGPGAKVQVLWGGRYWPSEIVQEYGGRYFIRYDNHSTSSDEWVGLERISLNGSDLGHFLQVGHCLAAILLGAVGGAVAVGFLRSRPPPTGARST